jgi:hypothetical protein
MPDFRLEPVSFALPPVPSASRLTLFRLPPFPFSLFPFPLGYPLIPSSASRYPSVTRYDLREYLRHRPHFTVVASGTKPD